MFFWWAISTIGKKESFVGVFHLRLGEKKKVGWPEGGILDVFRGGNTHKQVLKGRDRWFEGEAFLNCLQGGKGELGGDYALKRKMTLDSNRSLSEREKELCLVFNLKTHL